MGRLKIKKHALEKYCTKYGRYMEKTDRDDFRAIVDYLTNNINNNS